MFEPKFCLLIEQEAFIDKSAACLGSQLIQLANFLERIIPFCASTGKAEQSF